MVRSNARRAMARDILLRNVRITGLLTIRILKKVIVLLMQKNIPNRFVSTLNSKGVSGVAFIYATLAAQA